MTRGNQVSSCARPYQGRYGYLCDQVMAKVARECRSVQHTWPQVDSVTGNDDHSPANASVSQQNTSQDDGNV